MAGILTGAYEAVFQVSEGTINRLLATMHQNAFADKTKPSFPHSVSVRLGDLGRVDGVRGTAWAQIGVPRIDLVHGATDRFWLEVGVRVRYRPDPGTSPLPEFIHGTVRAMYALEDIDPDCGGWRHIAHKYLWFRVIAGTVSFEGDTHDGSPIPTHHTAETAAELNASVTRQFVRLLELNFDPLPHKLEGPFRRDLVVSFDQSSSAIDHPFGPDLPVGGEAVAIPIGLTADPPEGALGSLQHVMLGGRDISLAVGKDVIMGLIEPTLAQLRAFQADRGVHVDPWIGKSYTIWYHGSISKAIATWQASGSFATIHIDVEGAFRTSSDWWPDITFWVKHLFHLDFDAGAEQVRVWPAGTTTKVNASGIGVPEDVLQGIAQGIQDAIGTQAKQGAEAAGSWLTTLRSRRIELVDQVKTLDPYADARFDDALFHPDGLLLRGWVSVSGRRQPHVEFAKIDDDMFSAFPSWIPGGRIDSFEWSWESFPGAHDPGKASRTLEYVLKRPYVVTETIVDRTSLGGAADLIGQSGGPSKFGKTMQVWGYGTLPGLDKMGTVCLTLNGVRVDTTTGALVPVQSVQRCEFFDLGFTIVGHFDHPLFWRDYFALTAIRPPDQPIPTHLPPPPPSPHAYELIAVGGQGAASGRGSNTLVLFLDEWTDEVSATLLDGLAACRREDAGLLVVVLFPDGAMSATDDDRRSTMSQVAERLEAPLVVNEDVHGGWSDALFVERERAEPAWRLLSPDGGLVWMHDEPLGAGLLTQVLDGGLFPSGAPQLVPNAPAIDMLDPAQFWDFEIFHRRPDCPPLSVLRTQADIAQVVSSVSFVSGRDGADDQLTRATDRLGPREEESPLAVFVVEGIAEDEAVRREQDLGPGYAVLADPDGAVAARFGVRAWPTTVTVGPPDALAAPKITLMESSP